LVGLEEQAGVLPLVLPLAAPLAVAAPPPCFFLAAAMASSV
jgi:hypothetical protein